MHWEIIVRRAVPFDALEREQTTCVENVRQNPDLGYLLVSEPSATFTRGRSASEKDLLWNSEERAREQVGVQEVSRGGQWTFHGPGQIVLYPIVQLASLGLEPRDIRRFLGMFRTSLQEGMRSLGIEAQSGENPFGLFVDGAKLASFGMAFSRGVSSHGVAVYYGPQAHFFRGIHPCGQSEAKVTSLKELGLTKSWPETASHLVNSVKNSFKSL